MAQAEDGQCAGEEPGGVLGGSAGELRVRPGGIGQRPQQVEDGAHAQVHANRVGVLHGGVEGGREEKPDAHFADGAGGVFGRGGDLDAQRFQ